MSDDDLIAMEKQRWQELNAGYLAHMRTLNKDRLVASAVIVHDSKVLLLRRSPDDSYPGIWEYPGGGVESEEQHNIIEAIRREVTEEAGIETPDFPSGEVLVHPTRTALRVVLRFDLVDIDSQPEVVLSAEHDQFMWVSSTQAQETMVDGVNVFDVMRPENQGILLLVGREPNGSDEDSLL